MRCTRCKGTGRVSTVDMSRDNKKLQCICGMCYGEGEVSVKDWLLNKCNFITRPVRALWSLVRR